MNITLTLRTLSAALLVSITPLHLRSVASNRYIEENFPFGESELCQQIVTNSYFSAKTHLLAIAALHDAAKSGNGVNPESIVHSLFIEIYNFCYQNNIPHSYFNFDKLITENNLPILPIISGVATDTQLRMQINLLLSQTHKTNALRFINDMLTLCFNLVESNNFFSKEDFVRSFIERHHHTKKEDLLASCRFILSDITLSEYEKDELDNESDGDSNNSSDDETDCCNFSLSDLMDIEPTYQTKNGPLEHQDGTTTFLDRVQHRFDPSLYTEEECVSIHHHTLMLEFPKK